MDSEVMLIVSMVITGLAVLWSFYLLFQAVVDYRVLKSSGKNGPLKALSITAIVAETIRTAKLLLLQILFGISFALEPGQILTIRRIIILTVILLIASGSIYGGVARRALIRLVEEEKEASYIQATELVADQMGDGTHDGDATTYRIEQVQLPERPAPETE